MTGLVQRRHADTRDDVVAAALALFRERGFGQVTMADIAQAAGVSRRTVYRRFPTKDQIVLEVPRRWLDAWDEAVAARPDAPPRAVAEAACRAVARHIDAHRDEVLVAYSVRDASPAVAAAAAGDQRWVERLLALLRREPVDLPGATAHVIAGAYLGAVDAMMAHWVQGGGRDSVLELSEALLERLGTIWPTRDHGHRP